MCSNIPASPAYGVYISQLIRYAMTSSNYSDFLKRHLYLRISFTRFWRNSNSYEYKNKSARREAQFVPIGMPTTCWTVPLQSRHICYRWGTPAYWSFVPRSSMFYLYELCLKNMWNCSLIQHILSHRFYDWKLCEWFLLSGFLICHAVGWYTELKNQKFWWRIHERNIPRYSLTNIIYLYSEWVSSLTNIIYLYSEWVSSLTNIIYMYSEGVSLQIHYARQWRYYLSAQIHYVRQWRYSLIVQINYVRQWRYSLAVQINYVRQWRYSLTVQINYVDLHNLSVLWGSIFTDEHNLSVRWGSIVTAEHNLSVQWVSIFTDEHNLSEQWVSIFTDEHNLSVQW
jgi:hypothetical protein